MTSFVPQKLVREVPGDFPYRIAYFTRDSHSVLEMSRYDIMIFEDEDFPLMILCWGLVSVISENGRKVRYKRWSYDIHILDYNKTLIEVAILPVKKKKIEISSNIYRTSDVFKFFPSLEKLNKASKNKLLGKENLI